VPWFQKEKKNSKDIKGSPLSKFVEVPASTSSASETIRTLCVVKIPATFPRSVSCQCTCHIEEALVNEVIYYTSTNKESYNHCLLGQGNKG